MSCDNIRLLELFSGYGTPSFALKRLGIPYKIVGYSDIDKFANKVFKQNHCKDDSEDKLRLGDVTKINPNDLEDFDLLTAGFPCQSFSIAGKMLGELDSRGSLFNEIIRIAEVKKPKYMLLENVHGLLATNFQRTFNKILSELDIIGYNVYWEVLNTKDYGIPQNRKRIWFVCIRKDIDTQLSFQFPEKEELKIKLKDILEKDVDKKYYFSDKTIESIMKSNFRARKPIKDLEVCRTLMVGGDPPCFNIPENDSINTKTRDVETAINVAQDIANKEDKPVQIDIMHLKYGEIRPLSTYIPQDLDVHRCLQAGTPKEVLIEPKEIYPCINPNDLRKGFSGQNKQTIKSSGMIRRLTPKECFRLQGFLNDEVDLSGISDTQAYKLAGNGQSVNVVEKILVNMLFGKLKDGK